MTPDLALRTRIFDNVTKQLPGGSHFILVVPSLESALFTQSRLIEWNLRQGEKAGTAASSRFPDYKRSDVKQLREGVVPVDDVPTKHYLQEELIVLLEKRGMNILDIQKVEYGWNTEFARPPKWMQAPHPWDWLVVSQKTK